MPEFSNAVLGLTKLSKALHWRRAVQEQGGLLSGQDPTKFNTADPIRLWIIQLGVIIMTTQLLALALRKIRQPKVIAEVIGGILLGPTALGRIPGFTEHIFPQESRSYLSLVANIGLCLFLFLVGLEIDSGVIKRNARLSAAVALAGMTIPFGLGAALSVPLYKRFIDESIQFTHFMLFTGVAYSITAFPVLCRILTELKLLDTTVGIVVLSAGVGNDIIGWTLLALSVALVNAGTGIMALWILLTCVGWTLLLLFPARYGLHWLARWTGSMENGPTMFFMTATMLILFGSAFMTDIIGVHAIFGAFLAGLIVPREGGLAIALTEKLEDIVSIIFLPLYFTLSGLSTDLGLLNNGITWGFTIAICALAYIGKFGGCSIAARFAGFTWREASTIGSLMSCKGLVELIVLNVGLSAGILSQRVFSMFVLEALLLTFMTTPAVLLLYPPEVRKRVTTTGPSFAHVGDGANRTGARQGHGADAEGEKKDRFLVVLDRIEHLPGMMAITQLVQPPPPYEEEQEIISPKPGKESPHPREQVRVASPSESANSEKSGISLSALRLVEITDRTSAIMKYSSFSTAEFLQGDPLLSIFRMFVELGGGSAALESEVKMAAYDDLATCVKEEAIEKDSQVVLLPWVPPTYSQTRGREDDEDGVGTSTEPIASKQISTSPFEALFKSGNSNTAGHPSSTLHSHFVRTVFSQCPTDVLLYVDQDRSTISPSVSSIVACGKHHLFLPFIGGPDDRLALEFVVQLCATNTRVSATVLKLVKQELESNLENAEEKMKDPAVREILNRANTLGLNSPAQTVFPDTVYGNTSTQTRLQSDTADSILWARYATPAEPNPALTRISFDTIHTPLPLHTLVDHVSALKTSFHRHPRRNNPRPTPSASSASARNATGARLLVMCGRSRRLAVEDHHAELRAVMEEHGNGNMGSEVRKTLGDVAASVVLSGCETNLVVVQAAHATSG